MRYAAFAIGACDMDAFEPLVRMIQHGAQGADIGKVFFKCRGADPFKHRQFPVKKIEGFFVLKLNKGFGHNSALITQAS